MPKENREAGALFRRLLGRNQPPEELPQCAKKHAIDHSGAISTLRMDCEGCGHGSSLADEACRMQVTAKLIQDPVDKVEFARRLTTEEYEKEDVKDLTEIGKALVDLSGSSFGIYGKECGACAAKTKNLKETIIESLRKNPINAYRGLESPVEKEVVHTRPECRRCASLRIKALAEVKKTLDGTRLIKKAKENMKTNSKDIYVKAFIPKVRPFLSESRIVLDLPEDAKEISSPYRVCGAKVGLYRVDSWNEDLYHITPPEYLLRKKPKHLEVLMEAREWLLANASDEIDPTDNARSAKNKYESLAKLKLMELVGERKMALAKSEVDELTSILTRCTRGLDVIELMLLDPNINDVYVNSPMETTPVYVKHKDFDDCRTNVYLSEDRGDNFVLKFVLKSGIGLSANSPILDMDLEDLKTRVSVIAPPLSPDGIAFSLRCRNETPWTLPMLIAKRMINPLAAAFITTLVNDQVALLIVGGRGTGKSSFLGAVMGAMNPKYRVLTIEDTLELPVQEMNSSGFRVQRMLSRPVTTSEGLNITADDALRSSLRMGESSIVVGEVRGQEAKVLYESIRVGATGNTVLGTIHGRGPRDIFERVVYDLKIPATSFKATDAVVVTERLPVGRRITEIAELNKDIDIETVGSGEEANKLFSMLMEYDSERDELVLSKDFLPKDSCMIRFIAKRRGSRPEHVWEEVESRKKVYERILELGEERKRRKALELDSFVSLSKAYTSLIDEERRKDHNRYRKVDYQLIYERWLLWAEAYLKKTGDG